MQQYDDWNKLKQRITKDFTRRDFNVRDVFWCHMGMNIGYETYGKGGLYTRPVLILQKYSTSTFLGMPLSSKCKDRPYYYNLNVKGKNVSGLVSQIRTLDSKRLARRMTTLDQEQFNSVAKYVADGIFPHS